jgi:hypothetical protein
MKRREFLLGVTAASVAARPQSSIEVEVMEVFSSADGPSALLVHHANDDTRETFANWLQRNSGSAIVVQARGNPIDARIFRVGLCFGRGLILLKAASIGVRVKDLLSVGVR